MRLVDVVRKTHNLQCGIFGNISDDLGSLPFDQLSPMTKMAYAYARRFVAAGLYVQGVFSYEQYMYVYNIFRSLQLITTQDAHLRPGEDVQFQENALIEATELLVTYDHRFNVSYVKLFVTAVHTLGDKFPVLPKNSTYQMALDVADRQIASFVNSSIFDKMPPVAPSQRTSHENKKGNVLITCLTTKYATFSGRASRSEFWLFVLENIILSMVVGFLSALISNYVSGLLGGLLSILYILVLIVPSLAISVRRLHDSNKSGWFILAGLIPFIGGIVLLVLYLLPSDSGENRYGSSPR